MTNSIQSTARSALALFAAGVGISYVINALRSRNAVTDGAQISNAAPVVADECCDCVAFAAQSQEDVERMINAAIHEIEDRRSAKRITVLGVAGGAFVLLAIIGAFVALPLLSIAAGESPFLSVLGTVAFVGVALVLHAATNGKSDSPGHRVVQVSILTGVWMLAAATFYSCFIPY